MCTLLHSTHSPVQHKVQSCTKNQRTLSQRAQVTLCNFCRRLGWGGGDNQCKLELCVSPLCESCAVCSVVFCAVNRQTMCSDRGYDVCSDSICAMWADRHFAQCVLQTDCWVLALKLLLVSFVIDLRACGQKLFNTFDWVTQHHNIHLQNSFDTTSYSLIWRIFPKQHCNISLNFSPNSLREEL